MNAFLSGVPRRVKEVIRIQLGLWEYRVHVGAQLDSALSWDEVLVAER